MVSESPKILQNPFIDKNEVSLVAKKNKVAELLNTEVNVESMSQFISLLRTTLSPQELKNAIKTIVQSNALVQKAVEAYYKNGDAQYLGNETTRIVSEVWNSKYFKMIFFKKLILIIALHFSGDLGHKIEKVLVESAVQAAIQSIPAEFAAAATKKPSTALISVLGLADGTHAVVHEATNQTKKTLSILKASSYKNK